MAKIFISYRREDSDYPTLHIYEKLVDRFGRESVVFDVDTIPFGHDFRDYLNQEVGKCDILLAVIGDRWLDILKQRQDEPNDFVRIEIQAALERDIPVVPVLVKNASVPKAPDLPPELSELAYKQATEVRGGPDYQNHLKRLIKGLDNLISGRTFPEDFTKVEKKGTEPSPPESAKKIEKHKVEHPPSKQAVEKMPIKEGKHAEINKIRIGRIIPTLGLAVVALLICLSVVVWFYLPPGGETSKANLKSGQDDLLETITNSTGMKFALIPAGSFTMGSPESEEGRDSYETQHPVTITRPFYMQTTEVTQGQWKKVMGNNPSSYKNCGDNCPVAMVSWEDAQNFIEKLNAKEGVTYYRLPTEAEWEYAARAGSTTAFSFGDDERGLHEHAWYQTNSEGKPHPVGTKKPNEWGLYDMHGNVWEWVADWYDDYTIGSVADPEGPKTGTRRVMRGCSFGNYARYCRSADRYDPKFVYRHDYGFRLARSITLSP